MKLEILSEIEIHKYYLHIADPFVPRWLDTGRQTVKAQLKQTVRDIKEWGNEPCYDHSIGVMSIRRECPTCWLSLNKEIE